MNDQSVGEKKGTNTDETMRKRRRGGNPKKKRTLGRDIVSTTSVKEGEERGREETRVEASSSVMFRYFIILSMFPSLSRKRIFSLMVSKKRYSRTDNPPATPIIPKPIAKNRIFLSSKITFSSSLSRGGEGGGVDGGAVDAEGGGGGEEEKDREKEREEEEEERGGKVLVEDN